MGGGRGEAMVSATARGNPCWETGKDGTTQQNLRDGVVSLPPGVRMQSRAGLGVGQAQSGPLKWETRLAGEEGG